MDTAIVKSKGIKKDVDLIFLIDHLKDIPKDSLSSKEFKYLENEFKNDQSIVEINKYDFRYFFVMLKDIKGSVLEKYRLEGSTITGILNSKKIKTVQFNSAVSKNNALAFLEGMLLKNYKFLRHFTDKKNLQNSLNSISVLTENLSKKDIEELGNVTEAVFATRDLVNEPVNYLNAVQLAKEIEKLSKKSGFKVEVFNKKKIESLKMGGLLSVNQGSIDPPTFSIMEWKPAKPINKKPIVLVGKGVVYDTGGLSLKPTAGSMDEMKCDMGGAAVVIGTIHALALNDANVHVIGLVPATDNRPGGNAFAPGDVITMYNGKTVEVLNTDAEGRMILADALAYAQKLKPELVLDFATLTGSAQRAVGSLASVIMGTADDSVFKDLENSGNETYERVVKFPFWEEYFDMLKSQNADVKNIGGAAAGAITAGKFLEIFTKDNKDKHAYPWVHVDIAGPAFLSSPDGYRPKEGSGYGVRLMYHFLTNYKNV